MLLYHRLPMTKDICMQNSELVIIVYLLERFCHFVVDLAEVLSCNVTPRTGSYTFVYKFTVLRLVRCISQADRAKPAHCNDCIAANCSTTSWEGYSLHKFPPDETLCAK